MRRADQGASSDGPPGRNDDLEAEVTLTLREALLGWRRSVLHPGSGEAVAVGQGEGEGRGPSSAPGSVLVVAGKGMPRRPSWATPYQLTMEDGRVVEMQKEGAPLPPGGGSGGGGAVVEAGDLRVVVNVRLPDRLTREQEEGVRLAFPE